MMTNLWMLVALVAGLQAPAPDTSDENVAWKPAKGTLVTRWAAKIEVGLVDFLEDEKPRASAASAEGMRPDEVGRPPASLGLAPFYAKYKSANGLPVVGSAKVSDFAIKEAA